MYKPRAKTVKKLEKLEKQAEKVINNMRSKLGSEPSIEIGNSEKITTSAQMRKYIKDLEKIIGSNKIKRVKSKVSADLYVTQNEYEEYTKSYKKAMDKSEKFENSIRRRIRKKGKYNAYSNLTTLLEKSRVLNISYIRDRKEFLWELEKVKRVISKDFYKVEIGHYKRSYLKAAVQELREMLTMDQYAQATEIMGKIVKRLQSMHFKTFYQNYYSGKLSDINDIYTCKKLLRERKYESAALEAQRIYEGLF